MRNVNGLPVYEGTDPCALDDYSLALANVVKTLILDILSQNTEDIEDISYDISDLKSALRILEQEFELHDESISELINESGATIDLSFNNTNNKLTLTLKNKAGTAISTKTATLPLNNMIVDASYNNTTKELTFTKKDGSTKEVSIADLIDGLVSQDDFEQSQAEQDTEIEELQTKVTNLEETVNSELEDGVAEGTEITVNDSATADASLFPNGNTSQEENPSPENPKEIHVLKGSNTITISNSDNTKQQIKTLTLPNGMEMCNIGDYRDEFVKDLTNGKWYKNKKVFKTKLLSSNVYTGTNPTQEDAEKNAIRFRVSDTVSNVAVSNTGYSNYFIVQAEGNRNGISIYSTNVNIYVWISKDIANTVNKFKQFLDEYEVFLYYPLATPVLEEITDTTLIAELDELLELRTYLGQTNITVEAEDLAPMMTLNYKKSNRITIDNRITELERAVVALQSI